ncbi:hypothetical protein ABTZ58_32335 [Streptomyces sp. NPDC094143]
MPVRSLIAGLDLLAGQTGDFPRALALVREGTAVLGDRPARPVPGSGTPA